MSEFKEELPTGKAVWVGVDIGGTKTAVVLSTAPPAMLGRIEFPTLPDQGPERALKLISESIHQLIDTTGVDGANLAAIGVSCGGPLNQRAGIIQAPPNLATWVDIPITALLGREFGVRCSLENDANAGAVAEHRFGAGMGTEHMIFLTMGTGLGAGIIADGRLLSGADGQAGEIGHVRLSATGPVGYHKAGSVEGWASGGGVGQVARETVAEALAAGRPTALAGKFQRVGVLTARDVAEAAQLGDELARQIIASTGRRLGEALAILVDLFNPERIVIGGLAMRLGDSLLGPAREVLDREALAPSAARCQIVPALLGESIGDVAAICIAMGI